MILFPIVFTIAVALSVSIFPQKVGPYKDMIVLVGNKVS